MRAKTSSQGKDERTRGYETGQLGKPAAKEQVLQFGMKSRH